MGDNLLMNPDLEDRLLSAIDKTANYVIVGLSGESRSLTALKTGITAALAELVNQNILPSKSDFVKVSNQEETRKKVEELKDVVNRGFNTVNDSSSTGSSKVEGKLRSVQDSFEKMRIEEKSLARDYEKKFARVIEILSTLSQSIKEKVIEPTERKLNWLRDLENAGVKLAGGFDKAFTNLSDSAGLTHDEFVKFAIANSKTINQMSAKGIDGASLIAKATGSIITKFGLGANDATSIVSHYLDTITALNTDEELRNKNLNLEIYNLAKNFKMLSSGLGVSIEKIMEENKLRENNIFDMKMQSSPLFMYYTLLKNMGLDRNLVESIITGIPNEESVAFRATPAGQHIMSRLSGTSFDILSGRINGNDVAYLEKIVNEIGRSPMAQQALLQLQGMPYQLASILQRESFYNNAFGGPANFARFKGVNYRNSEDVLGAYTRDTESLANYESYLAARKQLANRKMDVFSLSTIFASDCLATLGKVSKGLADLLNTSLGKSIYVLGSVLTTFMPMALGLIQTAMIMNFAKAMYAGNALKEAAAITLSTAKTQSLAALRFILPAAVGLSSLVYLHSNTASHSTTENVVSGAITGATVSWLLKSGLTALNLIPQARALKLALTLLPILGGAGYGLYQDYKAKNEEINSPAMNNIINNNDYSQVNSMQMERPIKIDPNQWDQLTKAMGNIEYNTQENYIINRTNTYNNKEHFIDQKLKEANLDMAINGYGSLNGF